MKVWVEIPKDKSQQCFVFQYKPINRNGIDFGYENGPSDGIAAYNPIRSVFDSDLIKYLRDFTLNMDVLDESSLSFLYEVEL